MLQIVVYIRLLVDLLFFPQWLYIILHFINEIKPLKTHVREKALLSAFTPLSSLFATLSSTQTSVI